MERDRERKRARERESKREREREREREENQIRQCKQSNKSIRLGSRGIPHLLSSALNGVELVKSALVVMV